LVLTMTADAVFRALSTVLREMVEGAAADACWVLNPNDVGLLRSLDKLSAATASERSGGTGSSIAAHVDHLRYGFELLNRWSRGEENPFAAADYSVSWRRTHVSDREWRALLDQLGLETRKWLNTLGTPRELNDIELTGAVASVAHFAYHIGAIRQMNAAVRGPAESSKP
jgi:hypothetical protein